VQRLQAGRTYSGTKSIASRSSSMVKHTSRLPFFAWQHALQLHLWPLAQARLLCKSQKKYQDNSPALTWQHALELHLGPWFKPKLVCKPNK
jgi:hypothetical protein